MLIEHRIRYVDPITTLIVYITLRRLILALQITYLYTSHLIKDASIYVIVLIVAFISYTIVIKVPLSGLLPRVSLHLVTLEVFHRGALTTVEPDFEGEIREAVVPQVLRQVKLMLELRFGGSQPI